MAEEQLTIDGDTRPLPEPFFVIATQNPVEQEGTFELPEAQKDRFVIKTQLGYPDLEGELEIINRRAQRTTHTPTVEQVVSEEVIARLQQAPETVRVDQDIRQYISDIVRATRGDGRVKAGVSPRGTQRLFEAARAMATVNGRDHAIPDDVKRIASPVLAHRLVLTDDARVNNIQKTEVIGDILWSTAAPAGGRGTTQAGSGTGVPTGERGRAGVPGLGLSLVGGRPNRPEIGGARAGRAGRTGVEPDRDSLSRAVTPDKSLQTNTVGYRRRRGGGGGHAGIVKQVKSISRGRPAE